MRCTPELLKRIEDAVESIEYGTVRITVNEKGAFTEISIEKKDRVFKVSERNPFHSG
jgi:hypothetical protein